jgi:hypothetical protein
MINKIIEELKDGTLIPYIGLEIFKGAKRVDGSDIPADNDSLIIAMNNGRAMSPRLMFEPSRACMYLEQKKGRRYIEGMSDLIFNSPFEPLELHKVLTNLNANYIIDTNLDTKLIDLYSDRDHIVIIGIARITAEFDRFEIFEYDKTTKEYTQIDKEYLNLSLPIIFKPMGTFKPKNSLVISDADYVDWLTEAMGGYGVPPKLKDYREKKKYLFMGIDFSKDTNRMVANELTMNLDGGYLVTTNAELTKKEQKFITNHNLEVIQMNLDEFVNSVKEGLCL